jgi:hypothetical protein
MSGGATTFDVRVRTLECPRCGAPVSAAMLGGRAQCAYCSAVFEVATRASDARAHAAPSAADEVARLSRLKAQLEHPVTGHPYDLERAAASAAGVSLRDAWLRSKTAPVATPDEGRLLCWIALRLAEAERAAGRPLQARAALETALDRLTDEGHRHLVRCQLAVEAVREGDLDSAEGWLAECDPAPEILELDGPYREALARVRLARGDVAGVLAVLGERDEDVPFHPSLSTARVLLRLQALELSRRDADADRELRAAMLRSGDAVVMGALAVEGYAPRARLRVLAAERSRLARSFGAAAAPALALLPVLAFALSIGVLIPRCTFDADPLFGVNGYLLCPAKCPDCDGPLRLVTVWEGGNGEYSTNGPQYFCPSKTNGVARMTSKELEQHAGELAKYELGASPAATTYLFLLGLASPWVVARGVRRRREDAARRAELDRAIGALVAEAREPAPPDVASPSRLGGPALFVLGTVAVALLLVAVDLYF